MKGDKREMEKTMLKDKGLQILIDKLTKLQENGYYVSHITGIDTEICSVDDKLKEKRFIIELNKVVPKPILNREEKEYLEAVLKPFKDRTESIAKFCVDNESGIQFISIWIKSIFAGWGFERIDLPYFDKDTIYKDLELGKEYTLEELGLFEE